MDLIKSPLFIKNLEKNVSFTIFSKTHLFWFYFKYFLWPNFHKIEKKSAKKTWGPRPPKIKIFENKIGAFRPPV